jgi:hypothetical protein
MPKFPTQTHKKADWLLRNVAKNKQKYGVTIICY